MNSTIKKNIIYNFLYQILAILLPLITTPYISRVLGPTKIGEYSYAYAIAYYFVMLAMLGLNNYGNRTIATVRDDKRQLSKEFCEIYIMQLSFGVVAIALYVVYGLFISNESMTWILLLYVASAMFDINWFFFGMEEFKITVTGNAIIKLITTVLIFIVVKEQADINKYAMIMVIGILTSQIILWRYIGRYVYFCRVSYKDVLKHIKPNLILFVPIVAISLYKVMDKIMLGAMTSKAEVGLYESSEKIIQIPMALIQSLGTVMLPKMTNLVAKHDSKTASSYFSNSIAFVMFLSSSMSFGIMGVARYFVPLYFGDGYQKCIVLFQVLLPSCVFLAVANVIRTQFLIPRKRDRVYIISVFLGAGLNFAVNFVLIPSLKSVGAAIGTLISEAVVCLYQMFVVRKDIAVFYYVRKSIVFVIAAIVMYGTIISLDFYGSDFFNLLTHILIGALVYFGLVFADLFILKTGYKIIKKYFKR